MSIRHMVHFEARIELRGINPFVSVSAAQAELLHPGWRKPMPVLIQLDGQRALPGAST